ncbi:ABC transporter substrate-binding protein [Paenibacillus sp. NPDC058174]|uniref:ABC transporter substrate-binding protein n=1 Tax=Paenibacillus sp. NPDC058174 TaxID=3346366 RepID=UPI0036DB9B05
MTSSKKMTAILAAILLVAMIGLSGCAANGGSSSNVNNSQPTQDNGTTAPESSPVPDEGATRTVKDQFGEVTVPVHPQKVAGIYMEDYLKALDVTPVVQWFHPLWGTQEYLKLTSPTWDITGDMEKLLAYEPDLIFVDGGADAAKYEQYSKVAPTYRIPDSALQDPRLILTTVADVLGIPEKAEQLLSDYDKQAAETKSLLHEKIGDETVAVLRINISDKSINILGYKNRFIGATLYHDLGLKAPKMVEEMEAFIDLISMEAIPDLNADHLIILPSNGNWESPENQEAISNLFESPIWKSVPAVKNGHVYKVERSHWQTGAILANKLKMDDLTAIFSK